MGSKKGNTAKAKTSAKKKSSTKSTQQEKKEFMPQEHSLVPKHEVLDEKGVEQLLEKYDIDPTNLPTILGTDAALKGLGAVRGDIIKISRKSPTAGSTVFYRRVSYE